MEGSFGFVYHLGGGTTENDGTGFTGGDTGKFDELERIGWGGGMLAMADCKQLFSIRKGRESQAGGTKIASEDSEKKRGKM